MPDRVSAGQGETAGQDAKRLEQIRESADGDYCGGEGEGLTTAVDDVRWLLAERERLLVRVQEAHGEGYDQGREDVFSEPVCSSCGKNHDRDESAMCEDGEVVSFGEWVAKVGSRVQELTDEREHLLSVLRMANETARRRGGRVQEAERALRDILEVGGAMPDSRIRAIALAALGGDGRREPLDNTHAATKRDLDTMQAEGIIGAVQDDAPGAVPE